MTTAAVLLLVVAALWLGLGLFWLTHPGPQPRTRLFRRVQGLLLIASAPLLSAVAVALLRRT